MQYMGSKNRLSKELMPFILKNRKEGQYYVEPFVGGANMMNKITGNRIAADSNDYLIALWDALQKGWIPPNEMSKEEYIDIKDNKDNHPKELVAFAGFMCSFGAKWFGGYAKNARGDNYAKSGHNVLLKEIKKMQDVQFIHTLYQNLEIPENSVIYCDPPYENTTSYKDSFDHEEFWEWCRQQVRDGHQVFVSEYNAPSDFNCVWEKEVKTLMNQNQQDSKRIEKLFVLELN